MTTTAEAQSGGSLRSPAEEFLRDLCTADGELITAPVVLVCAHPDDETIGVGTRLPRLVDVRIVHVTDGAPKGMEDVRRNGFETCAAYSQARRREVEAAVKLAGVSPARLTSLAVPDQEATRELVRVTLGILHVFRAGRPAFVITHPYEGGHPDHDAAAFAVHAACTLLERQSGAYPTIVEMTSYHIRDGAFTTGDFLPGSGEAPVFTARLGDSERILKEKMVACFPTQAEVLKSFTFCAERFRVAPRYDFSCPPHSGRLLYEHYPWGMTGERFRMHVAAALHALELPEHILL